MTNESPQDIPKKSDKAKAKDKENSVNLWLTDIDAEAPTSSDSAPKEK